jgi:hypothetical protein
LSGLLAEDLAICLPPCPSAALHWSAAKTIPVGSVLEGELCGQELASAACPVPRSRACVGVPLGRAACGSAARFSRPAASRCALPRCSGCGAVACPRSSAGRASCFSGPASSCPPGSPTGAQTFRNHSSVFSDLCRRDFCRRHCL